MTSIDEKTKMKSWADHCSSDEESVDELHPARFASNSNENDLSYDDDSEGHISVTAEDDLDHLGPSSGGGGNGVAGPHGGGGAGGGRRGGNGRRNNNNDEPIPYPRPIDFDNLPPELPKQPPYTAYIRNLCYKIQEPGELADKVEGMTKWRYQRQHEVRVINARLGIDHNTGKRKGFGYVEFETPEELMLFLNLNDGYSRIHGRDLTIDIANNSRGPKNSNRNNYNRRNNGDNNNNGNNLSDIDGKQFRGGRYSKSSGGAGSSNNSSSNQNNTGPAPSAERRSLKLAPRSKPVGDGRSTSQSSIFGDAKPRDEESWRKKKEELDAKPNAPSESENNNGEQINPAPSADPSTATADVPIVQTGSTTGENAKDNQNANGYRNNDGRGSGGRGGRGRGGERRQNSSRGAGGRGGGRGRGRNNRRNSDRDKKNISKDADGWDEAKGGGSSFAQQQEPETKMPSVEKTQAKSTKVTNKFAVFQDSDSESD